MAYSRVTNTMRNGGISGRRFGGREATTGNASAVQRLPN